MKDIKLFYFLVPSLFLLSCDKNASNYDEALSGLYHCKATIEKPVAYPDDIVFGNPFPPISYHIDTNTNIELIINPDYTVTIIPDPTNSYTSNLFVDSTAYLFSPYQLSVKANKIIQINTQNFDPETGLAVSGSKDLELSIIDGKFKANVFEFDYWSVKESSGGFVSRSLRVKDHFYCHKP